MRRTSQTHTRSPHLCGLHSHTFEYFTGVTSERFLTSLVVLPLEEEDVRLVWGLFQLQACLERWINPVLAKVALLLHLHREIRARIHLPGPKPDTEVRTQQGT